MIEYKSKFDSNYHVYILYPTDDIYDKMKEIIPAGDIAFTDLKKQLIIIDGVAVKKLSKNYIFFIEAHEISHHKLNHIAVHANAKQEMEADYGAYLLLNKYKLSGAMQLVEKYWPARHTKMSFLDFQRQFGKDIARRIKITQISANESKILAEVIKVDMGFISVALNKYKKKLLNCKTTAECTDVLNDAFNKYWILFSHSKTPSHKCIDRRWAIDTASTIPTTQSKDGSMVKVIIGKDFANNLQAARDDAYWRHFINMMTSVIEHEYVHKSQLTKMPAHAVLQTFDAKKTQDTINYLSIPHEIMSFAVQAVREFQAGGYARDEVLKRISRPFDNSFVPKIEESDIFYTYTYFFKPGDIQLKRFLKNMYEYIV